MITGGFNKYTFRSNSSNISKLMNTLPLSIRLNILYKYIGYPKTNIQTVFNIYILKYRSIYIIKYFKGCNKKVKSWLLYYDYNSDNPIYYHKIYNKKLSNNHPRYPNCMISKHIYICNCSNIS